GWREGGGGGGIVMEGSFNVYRHGFLGEGHERNERRTWLVIALCSFMMIAEIAGGILFGSIALVADGLHMSTHVSALLLAALMRAATSMTRVSASAPASLAIWPASPAPSCSP